MKELIQKIRDAIDAGCYDEALRLLGELEDEGCGMCKDCEYGEEMIGHNNKISKLKT